jgi:hypothetical protein
LRGCRPGARSQNNLRNCDWDAEAFIADLDDSIWSDRLLKKAPILRRMAAARWNKSRRQPLLSGMEFNMTEIIAWNYRPRFTRTVDSARELQAVLEASNLRKAARTLSGSTFMTCKKSGFKITPDQNNES